MNGSWFNGGRPSGWGRVIAESEQVENAWTEDELAAVWRHQLRAPVAPMETGVTFGELIAHPAPPLEWLCAMKDFAKLNANHPESLIPREMALAMYYLSIALAWVRHNEWVTRLTSETVRSGVQWTLDRPWLDDCSRAVLEHWENPAGE